MKTRSFLAPARLLPATALLASALVVSVHATSYSWNQTTAGPFNWSDAANWTTSIPSGGPSAAGDGVTFQTTLTASQTINLAISGDSFTATKTIGSMAIGTSSGNFGFTLQAGTGSGVLNFDTGSTGSGGTHATLIKQATSSTSSAASDTISAPITLTSFLDITNNETTSAVRLNLSGVISGAGGIVINGPGVVNMSGANSFTGGLTLNGGTIQINGTGTFLGNGTLTINGGSLATSSAAATLSDTNGLTGQTWAGDFSASVGNGGINLGTSGVTLSGNRTVTVANGSSTRGLTVGGVIADGGGTARNLTISASGGFVALGGLNTYTGTTTVNAGALLVNGSIGSGAVTVNNTGTLGGTGSLSGATTVVSGAFLAPGATLSSSSVGTLTFASTLDISGLASGTGGLIFGLGSVGASDKITLTSGALTIGSGVLDLNDFSFTTLGGFGAGTYTLLSSSTSIIGTLGSNLTGTVGGLNGALSISGNDIILTVSAVPEPSTYAAIFGVLTLGGAFIARRRRR